jgi:translation initiation factor 2B subunit (eIF-2B alpha/beta/delta family)
MKKAEKELEIIVNDKVHGSSELLELIYSHFLKYKDDNKYLIKSLNRINNKLSHFPVIMNFTKEIEKIFNGRNPDNLVDYLIDFSKQQSDKYKNLFIKASKVLSKHKTVLTISHSKTLIKIFGLWKKSCPNLKVIICESRPNNEGILMADELSKFKITTEVITESMSGKVIKEVDTVILGADQILRNDNIINKTGSRMLAILAKYQKIPVYVLASSDKIVHKRIIINENFEEIEKELITKIFTD